MRFANIVFDTWVEGGQGQASLRRALSGLMARLAGSPGPPAHSLQLQDQAGLLCVSCTDMTADLEAVRRERASAVFSIGPAGETRPLLLPGMATAPRAPQVVAPQSSAPRNDDDAPMALFGTATAAEPTEAQGPAALPDQGNLTTASLSLREALGATGPHPVQGLAAPLARPSALALDFAAPDGRPLADYRVQLCWSACQLELRTDASGQLRLNLPDALEQAELTLFLSDEPGHALCWTLTHREQPLGALESARQALHLLGYPSGSLAPHHDLGLAQALAKFQADLGLEPSGALDPETAALLAGAELGP